MTHNWSGLIGAVGIAALTGNYFADLQLPFPENLPSGNDSACAGGASWCDGVMRQSAENAWQKSTPERRKECAERPTYKQLFLCLVGMPSDPSR